MSGTEKSDAILIISALDPSGGAGMSADIKTAHALKFYPCPVVTAVTYQNTCKITGIFRIPEVERQVSSVVEDVEVSCVKAGACAKVDYLKCAEKAGITGIKVYDPVLRASVGYSLTPLKDAVKLASESDVITPNREEAAEICRYLGVECGEAEEICEVIHDHLGCKVVVTGVVDVAYDGRKFEKFEGKHSGEEVHGTGCVFSTALACYLVTHSFFDAVKKAKAFVSRAALNSLDVGRCKKVVNP